MITTDPESHIHMLTPDRSSLAEDQIHREMQSLRHILETRMSTIDKEMSLFQEALKSVPHEVDKRISQLNLSYEIRLKGMEREISCIVSNITSNYDRVLREMDLRYQQRHDADEKAAEKVEAAQRVHNINQNEWKVEINNLIKTITDRARTDRENMINALRDNTHNSVRNLTDKIDSVISRIDRMDGRGAQSSSTKSTIISLAAIVISFVMAGFTIVTALKGNSEPDRSVNPPVTYQNLATSR